ncbi:hypothetical protein I4F81_010505 [Pyropia yezoensis]|uniref:Uncharacterized protein n=1 Tax=Pyropia yezoensis TaxID=2788 RepID=A0ACC3CDV2_PYRYE|nr:hypothetical protein I4F81_010505 [Neopyropia yezoensis]
MLPEPPPPPPPPRSLQPVLPRPKHIRRRAPGRWPQRPRRPPRGGRHRHEGHNRGQCDAPHRRGTARHAPLSLPAHPCPAHLPRQHPPSPTTYPSRPPTLTWPVRAATAAQRVALRRRRRPWHAPVAGPLPPRRPSQPSR